MEKLSNIVITLDGKQIGYILDFALRDWQKIGYFIVDEETEGEFLLRNEDILCQKGNFVLIEDVSHLEFVSNRENLRGKQIMDVFCNDYGIVQSFSFVKNKCVKIITNKCELATKFVEIVGRDCIFISSKKKKSAKKREQFPKFEGEDFVVKTMEEQKVALPEKVNLSPSFYIGKMCTQDVFGYNNERIVAKGNKITKSVFDKAKLHNKLNQLFFSIDR
ncbi:MAG: hypothetical protein ACI4R8_05270 [Candidatus Caccovivens sp.]